MNTRASFKLLLEVSSVKPSLAAVLGSLSLLVASPLAEARPRTYAPVVSTFDVRASSLVAGYQHGFIRAGGMDVYSGNANFTSTSGLLSAQFGLHYLKLDPVEQQLHLQGVSTSAVALFTVPTARRYENGMPSVALGPYVGLAPTALIGGRANFLSVPLVLGLSVPYSPLSRFTVCPWFELAPSFNYDAVIQPLTLDESDLEAYETGPESVTLSENDVESIVDRAIETDFSMSVPMRGGLAVAAALSPRTTLQLSGSVGTFGSAFQGAGYALIGAGLSFRWDSVVAGIKRAPVRAEKASF